METNHSRQMVKLFNGAEQVVWSSGKGRWTDGRWSIRRRGWPQSVADTRMCPYTQLRNNKLYNLVLAVLFTIYAINMFRDCYCQNINNKGFRWLKHLLCCFQKCRKDRNAAALVSTLVFHFGDSVLDSDSTFIDDCISHYQRCLRLLIDSSKSSYFYQLLQTRHLKNQFRRAKFLAPG